VLNDQKKNHKGAYWKVRYHATAVGTDRQPMQRAVYVDLNMEKLGVKVEGCEMIGGDGSCLLR
jgi:hypothetical protein